LLCRLPTAPSERHTGRATQCRLTPPLRIMAFLLLPHRPICGCSSDMRANARHRVSRCTAFYSLLYIITGTNVTGLTYVGVVPAVRRTPEPRYTHNAALPRYRRRDATFAYSAWACGAFARQPGSLNNSAGRPALSVLHEPSRLWHLQRRTLLAQCAMDALFKTTPVIA